MDWNKGSQFEKPELGSHVARCIKVIDLGTQISSFKGEQKSQRKVMITFEMPTQLMQGTFKPELAGMPFAISQRYTQSLDERSNLYQDLVAWRGKDFTAEELISFKPQNLLGVPAMISLKEDKTGKYINIGSISPVPKGIVVPKQINPSVYFTLNEFDVEVFNSFSEKLRATIASSPEYKAVSGANLPEADDSFNPDSF